MKQYPNYKDTEIQEIGKIPVHWELSRLKNVISLNDETLGENTPNDFLINYAEIGDVSQEKGIYNYSLIPFAEAPSRARRKVKSGDVIVSTVRTYLRAIARIDECPENLIVSTGFAVLRPKLINSSFLGFLMVSDGMINKIIANSTGVSYPAINAGSLIKFQIPFPPKLEQIAIAAFLDHKTAEIEELIAAKEVLITKLEAQRKAIINEAVTGRAYKTGLIPSPDGKPVKFKDSGIDWLGKIPKHWEVKKLKYCAKKITTGKTPSTDNDDYFRDGTIKWYSPGDFKSLVLEDSNRKITKKAVSDLNIELYPPKTVLFVGIGATLGKVAITYDYCYSNQQINVIQFNTSMLAEYGLLYFEAFKDVIANYANSATLAILNQTQTKNLLFLLPNISEQQLIIDYLKEKLDLISELQVKAKKSISKLNNYKQSLISEAVTGKIDVRNWQKD